MALTRRDLFRTGATLGLTGSALSVTTFTAAATETKPKVWTTAEWAARPPKEPIEVLARTPAYIVVHHTATKNSEDLSKEQAFKLSRAIQNYHMDSRGWIDTGQQFTISRGGHLTEGRHRSLEIVRAGAQHVRGAHVANRNSEVIGIENEGTYTTVEMPQAQWDSLVDLVTFLARQYKIKPSEICGHRDFANTQCPGDLLYKRLPELRKIVGERLAVPVTQPERWPLLRPGDTGPRVLAAQHLLRDRGDREVPTDGVFGSSTFAAMSRFARSAGLPNEPCYATAVADESGLIGAAAWPLLIRQVDPNGDTDAAKAARALSATGPVVETQDWRMLLDG